MPMASAGLPSETRRTGTMLPPSMISRTRAEIWPASATRPTRPSLVIDHLATPDAVSGACAKETQSGGCCAPWTRRGEPSPPVRNRARSIRQAASAADFRQWRPGPGSDSARVPSVPPASPGSWKRHRNRRTFRNRPLARRRAQRAPCARLGEKMSEKKVWIAAMACRIQPRGQDQQQADKRTRHRDHISGKQAQLRATRKPWAPW